MQLKFGGLLLKHSLQKNVVGLITFSDAFPATPGPLSSTDPIFAKLNSVKVGDIYKCQVSKFVFNQSNTKTVS